jgi:hypothetical protein
MIDPETKREIDVLRKQVADIWAHLFPRKKETDTSGTAIELVALTSDGGGGGDESTPCDYTYAFTTADGASHTGESPVQNRLPAALAATFGLWDSENERLVALDEWPNGGPCGG